VRSRHNDWPQAGRFGVRTSGGSRDFLFTSPVQTDTGTHKASIFISALPHNTYTACYREKCTFYTIHWLVAGIKRAVGYLLCSTNCVLNAGQVKASTFPPLEHWNVVHTVKVKLKVKQSSYRPITGPGGSRRLRLPDF
jgi:hypothetical protein